VRKWLALAGLCLSGALFFCLASSVGAQPSLSEEDEHFVIFNETIQVSNDGHAHDLCFEDTGFNLIRTNQMIWIADPLVPGVKAIASRPIRDVAKAGESMGTRAGSYSGQVVAVHVNQENSYLINTRSMLYVIHKGWVDSLQIGPGLAPEVDVTAGSNGLTYVLWGGEVRIYADPPGKEPMWIVPLPKDVRPVVSIAVGSRGEVLLAGQGSTALAVYDLDDKGDWVLVRSALRDDLNLGTLQGMCLAPGMLLPERGREGWVERDRFLFLSDSEVGELLALEMNTFEVIGRKDIRSYVPFASPARVSISNRGQIAFVDRRANAAYVLPTSVTLDLVRAADFRWRLLDRPGVHKVLKEDVLKEDSTSPQGDSNDGEGG
jgi:hypothetical protein